MKFNGHVVYQQTVGIPMGNNYAPLVADLFLYSYEADCVQHLQKSKFKKQKTSFNLTFRCIDYVLSLNSNIPESPAYGVFDSQLIRDARVCSKYEDLLFRGSILVSKLWKFDSQLIRDARVCSKYEDLLFRGSILVSKLWKEDILYGNF